CAYAASTSSRSVILTRPRPTIAPWWAHRWPIGTCGSIVRSTSSARPRASRPSGRDTYRRRNGLPCLQQAPRLQKVRTVDHLPVQIEHPRPGRCGKGSHDAPCARQLALGRSECPVDRGDLVGVNGELAGEPVTARLGRLALQPRRIPEVDVDAVEGLDTQG